MVLLSTLQYIGAKVETTVGTPETLAAADTNFLAQEPVFQSTMTVQPVEDGPSMNYQKGAAGARGGTATFRTFLEWDGSATLPPWAEVLLPACGFVKSGTTFTPRSEGPGTNVKTVTLGKWQGNDGGGWLYKRLAGAAGTFVINLVSGDIGFIEWTFTGVYQEVDDANPPPAHSYEVSNHFRYAGADTTYDSIVKCIQQTNVDAGNNVILRECSTAEAGFISGLVTTRRPMINMNPEATLKATQDIYGNWQKNIEAALAVSLNNAANNATIDILAPKAQIDNSQEGDRNGIAIDTIDFACNKNGTTKDEELSITFTGSV